MSVTVVSDPSRTAQQLLAASRDLVETSHRAAVDRLPDPVRHLVGYHIGWWDQTGRPAGGDGKSVRPALVLACAAAVGGDPAGAVCEAVAIELVHDFSLLHDDIMDGDLTRRHRLAAWSLFGVSEALLAGDMLVTLACDLLAGRPGLKALTTAVLDLCAGQSADLAFEHRPEVGVAECLAMAAGKTGALLAAACGLGALAGGGDARQVDLLTEFGRHLGLAFQLVDDLLGIWGDPAATGKPARSDLANRKKSLPVVAALASGTTQGQHLAWLYQREHDGDPDTLDHLAALIDGAGARAWAQAEADRHLDAALDCLSRAVPQPATGDLTVLARLVTSRDR